MKVKVHNYIGESPTKLHLRLDLLYGKNDRYRHHLQHVSGSLDKGIDWFLDLDKLIEDLTQIRDEYEDRRNIE